MKKYLLGTIIIVGLFSIYFLKKENSSLEINKIDDIVKKYQEKLETKDIIVSVMDSKTAKIMYLNDEKLSLNYIFEPGYVFSPVVLSLGIEKNLIKKNETIFAYNKGKIDKEGYYPKGVYKLQRFTLRDSKQFKRNYITLDDVVVGSSSIGFVQYAQRLSGEAIYDGIKKFQFAQKTGMKITKKDPIYDIYVPYEEIGLIPKKENFSYNEKKDNIYKATVSYGKGLYVNFMQLMKSYMVFNNNGYSSTPFYESQKKEVSKNLKKIIDEDSANEMKRLLIKRADKKPIKDLSFSKNTEIGFMSGISKVAIRGKYKNKYVINTFGFVNIKNKKYILGVTVIEPKFTNQYNPEYSTKILFGEIIKVLEN